ncbi:MAG: NAD(+) synthase [Lachnospiraceae bacterium]|nr:NAD(+) synthase [Lachnospiraceae bacterium]
MKDGFIKVASVTPQVRVADVTYNVNQIAMHMTEATEHGAKVVVFPELAVTGYTCGDLFYQDTLLRRAKDGLLTLAEVSAKLDAIFFVGLPLVLDGKLYNVAAVLHRGEVLGLIPKMHLPVYAEFYEARQFTPGMEEPVEVMLGQDYFVPMGTRQMFRCQDMPELVIAAEICEDLWSPCPPSTGHCMHGATVMVNLSASDEVTGKSSYRRDLVVGQSARLYCGYLYTSAGEGESTQDVVYSGHNIIAEAGSLLEESVLFSTGCIMTEIDVKKLTARRKTMSTFSVIQDDSYLVTDFSLQMTETNITRFVDKAPFVPSNAATLEKRCEEILDIQSMGLKKRLAHTHCGKAVVGISGGLDSTLALLVTVRAFDMLDLDRKGIIAVTMPGFGTTDRTYNNAVSMIKELGVTFREISIKKAVEVHFEDIGQPSGVHDVTYENSQARERTQILMDIANMENGLVIGTGDMSELALGWATYNGDHMSMYGVNVSVPKTLVRHLVQYYASHCCDGTLSEVLYDVLDTPVSPELLPPEDGKISQKTEELVGPYELHDFFLYYLMRYGCEPTKIYRLAKIAFAGEYDDTTILKWLKTFYRRFFSQQFKRSCLPDGPKVGTVSLSPRGDLRMPSDASVSIWMEKIEGLEESCNEKTK